MLSCYNDININIVFKHEVSRCEYKVTMVKLQCRLDMRRSSFSQRTMNGWNKLSIHCVNASRVNMFKNRLHIDKELLSTCHLEFVTLDGNLVKCCKMLKVVKYCKSC